MNPVVTDAVCNADGTLTDPTITATDTDGVTYKTPKGAKAGDTVFVTATAADGSKFAETEGWTLADDAKTATFEITLENVDCSKTTDPGTNPPAGKPEAPKPTPPTAQHPLAATGLTSTPMFMGGAALIVLAGLLLVGARRKA